MASTWSLGQMETAVRNHADPEVVKEQHVVVVAIDGVRWQEVFLGVDRELAEREQLGAENVVSADRLLPKLSALVADQGIALGAPSRGSSISASGPNHVSTPGYMEILTGRRRTPCADNGCRPVGQPTLLDEIAAVPGIAHEDVALIGSWEGLEKAASIDPSRIAMSVGRSHGETRQRIAFDARSQALLEAGERAGPRPGRGDFRRDPETAELALYYLRHKKPRFLFIGLGEPDEHAHHGNYTEYLTAIRYADDVIGRVHAELAAFEREGRAVTLLVTTDHGRSSGFRSHGTDEESARVWLVAAGTYIRSGGYVRAPAPRYLADLAPTLRALLGLPSDPSIDAGVVLHEIFDPARTALTHSERERLALQGAR